MYTVRRHLFIDRINCIMLQCVIGKGVINKNEIFNMKYCNTKLRTLYYEIFGKRGW